MRVQFAVIQPDHLFINQYKDGTTCIDVGPQSNALFVKDKLKKLGLDATQDTREASDDGQYMGDTFTLRGFTGDVTELEKQLTRNHNPYLTGK